MKIQKDVGAKIRFYRKKRGLSLEELAQKIYKSKSIVSKYELGQANIDVPTLYEIASALEIPIKSLLDFPDERAAQTSVSRYSIFTESLLYLYIMEQDRKGKILHCGVLTFSEEDDSSISATLYMDVDEIHNYTDCGTVFQGRLFTSPYNASLLLTNPLEPSDHISIFTSISRASKNMCSGFYFGYTLLDNSVFCTNMILSTVPLSDTETLKEMLMVTKEKLKLLKNGNIYMANEYIHESNLIK